MGIVAILAAGMVPWDKVFNFKPSSAALPLAEDKRQKDEYAKPNARRRRQQLREVWPKTRERRGAP